MTSLQVTIEAETQCGPAATLRYSRPKGFLTAHELNWTELNWPQLHDAFIGHARQRHDMTAPKLERLVLSKFVRCEHFHWKACVQNSGLLTPLQFRSVQFMCGEQTLR